MNRRKFLQTTATAASILGSKALHAKTSMTSVAQNPASKPMPNDICFLSAREMAARIATRKLSAREVMAAHLEQIERVNPRLNAIVAQLDGDACLRVADGADQAVARGEKLGALHGLPIAFKDLEPAIGFPWSRGSLIYANTMATENSGLVARLRAAGALAIGKTNTPEFGMGSHTYNKVYGVTRNAFDQTKSAGGSSGGAAVALATGMLPIADGSDFGGSLRNPGNFNNIVGFRPSVGLVTTAPTDVPFLGYSVKGPMARSVSDVAFLLSAMAGPDPRDPGTFPLDAASFTKPLGHDVKGTRVAWCPALGGLPAGVPMDARVLAVLDAQRKTFEDLGCIVEDACPPGIEQADEIFLTIRRWRSWARYAALLREYRALLKPEAIEEIELGARITADQVTRAMAGQSALMQRMDSFQRKYPFLLCAVNQVPPFDAEIDWPHEIAGVKMTHYVEWMKTAYWISATFCPALSVPAGFTSDGLPVGIQIVGRFRDDLSVLRMGHAFEQATKVGEKRPPIAIHAAPSGATRE